MRRFPSAFVFFVLTWLMGCMACAASADGLLRSVLILDQSTRNAPWSQAVQSSLESTLRTHRGASTAIYAEHLDFGLFPGQDYEESLRRFLGEKYQNIKIDVIIALGPRALDFISKARSQLWPQAPVVFASVDDAAAAKVKGLPDMTGSIMRFALSDLVASARMAMPAFARVAIVGDTFKRQPFRRHFTEEMKSLSGEVEFIDLTGQPMTALRERLSRLSADTAIIYTNMYSDGQGVVYTPRDALAALAEVANRPIVVDVETFVGAGAIGGYVVKPEPIGAEAGRQALSILEGKSASEIEIATGDFKSLVFDWRQMRRWGIDESQLPAGSEIRFRPPSAWDQYRWQIILILTAMLAQSVMIVGLIYEHRRRRLAELEARHRLAELAHMNRRATAGELSASIAHEINQPLAAIVSNGSAGVRWLAAKTPNVEEAVAALKRIVRDGHRASQIIETIRGMLKKESAERTPIDMNDVVREVISFLHTELQRQRILMKIGLSDNLPKVLADRVQMQQVILNLMRNAVEAMSATPDQGRVLRIESEARSANDVVVTIEDSGCGVGPENMDRLFEAFFTTKPNGMGMGLSICRSIVEAHGGRLSGVSGRANGSVFEIALPASSSAA